MEGKATLLEAIEAKAEQIKALKIVEQDKLFQKPQIKDNGKLVHTIAIIEAKTKACTIIFVNKEGKEVRFKVNLGEEGRICIEE